MSDVKADVEAVVESLHALIAAANKPLVEAEAEVRRIQAEVKSEVAAMQMALDALTGKRATRKRREKVPCPRCGKPIDPAGFHYHNKSHDNPASPNYIPRNENNDVLGDILVDAG